MSVATGFGRAAAIFAIVALPSLASPFVARPAAAAATGSAIRGLDYGPFRNGQSPARGIFPTPQQLRQDMKILVQHTGCVRFYSEANGFAEAIPAAVSIGLSVIPGAFLIGGASDPNDLEIASLVDAVNKYEAAARFPLLVVGTEPISQQGVPLDYLLSQIRKVRHKTNNSVPVATAEEWPVWIENPALAKAVDVILVDVYPYYEGKSIDGAADYAMSRVMQVHSAYPDKTVLIGETGWPSHGETIGSAIASVRNEEAYASAILRKTAEKSVGILYFEAFDEHWKIMATGMQNQGHFGLFTARRAGLSAMPKGRVQNTFQ